MPLGKGRAVGAGKRGRAVGTSRGRARTFFNHISTLLEDYVCLAEELAEKLDLIIRRLKSPLAFNRTDLLYSRTDLQNQLGGVDGIIDYLKRIREQALDIEEEGCSRITYAIDPKTDLPVFGIEEKRPLGFRPR